MVDCKGIYEKLKTVGEDNYFMHTRVTRSWMKHLDFILADLICINLTFLCAYFLRVGEFKNMYADNMYRILVIAMVLIHFAIIFFTNHYSGILRRGYLNELKAVLGHNVMLIGIMFTYMFVTQVGEAYSRIILVSFFLLNTIMMYLIHIVFKYIQRKTGTQESLIQNILIVTEYKNAKRAIEKITDGPDKVFNIVGIALIEDDTKPEKIDNIPVVANENTVYEYACRNVVDGVYIYIEAEQKQKIENIANKFLEMGITVHINMDMYIEGISNTYFSHLNSARVMTASINNVSPIQQYEKRAIDIVAGFFGCLITGLIYIFVAPAIKIADPKGPVFFAQTRAGRNGRPFKIYKFRSMYADAEERKQELMKDNKMDGLMFKIDADPRVIGSGPDGTKKGLGHFLRASSIDEFPNFWSILKGDMSLVGTRPPTMDEYEKYELHHKSRLAAKPGLTGMWQVSGRSDMTDFEEIVKLDNEYIKNWTIGLDLRIMVKTVIVVLKRKGSV